MKTTTLWTVLLVCAGGVWAQTNSGPLPPIPTGTEHTDLRQLWFFGVAAVTPLIIAGVKKFVPTIPKVLIPCASPLVGLLVGIGLNALGAANLSWVDMSVAGGLGVTIREIVDQATKQFKPPAA